MNERDEKKQAVLDALKGVRDPGSGEDLVTRGFVTDVTHCDGAVKVTLTMGGTPPVREAVVRQTREAVNSLAWVKKVTIKEETPPEPAAAADPTAETGSSGIRSFVAVASGKGGVGKSTIAANLAAGLARRGADVGLLDADVYGPSIPMMLGVKARPEVTDCDGRKMLEPPRAHGLKLMSMGFLVEDDKPVIWRGPMLHGALKQFFNDVNWGSLDYLVVDLPPGTGDVALTMVQTIKLTGAVIVSTPQNVAMLDAKKALAMFAQTGVSVLGIVENMAGDVFGSGTCALWAKEQKVGFLGSIPLEAGIRISGDAGVPAVLSEDAALRAPLENMVDQVEGVVKAALAGGGARKKISIQR